MDELTQQLDESQRLLDAARGGDASSLWQLTEELRPYLKAVVANLLDDHLGAKLDASDVVQQVMTAAVEKFAQFDGRTLDQWQAWLLAIARNEARGAIRFWRQQRRDADREIALSPGSAGANLGHASTPSKSVQKRQELAQLMAALDCLGPEDQQLIRWRHFQGLSHAAIAVRLEITEATARQRWRAALRRLRQQMEAEG